MNRESLYIASSQWKQKTHPFPYYYIQDFFHENFHQALNNEFQKVLDKGLSEEHTLKTFKRFDVDVYDAYSYVLPPDTAAPFDIFYSLAWQQFVSSLFPGLYLTPDVSSSCHHHKVGSNSGFIHNDFTTTDFLDNTLANGINPWYFHSLAKEKAENTAATNKKRLMRSIMVLYYLNNPPWKEGDGGETGLYTSPNDTTPTVSLGPTTNSILIFEVTPHSYHAFRYNQFSERNCIVQCFHSDVEYKLSRHPGFAPVYNDF